MKEKMNRFITLIRDGFTSLSLRVASRLVVRLKTGREEGLAEPVHFRPSRTIVWVNIICQLLFPLALSFTPAVVSGRQGSLSENSSALQAGLDVTPASMAVLMPPSTVSPVVAPQHGSLALPDLGADATGKALGEDGNVPQGGGGEREHQEKLDQSMGAAQQMWGILGGPSPRDQGLERATGIASGMANQAVQNWLSHYGNARISFSTQGTGSADVLVPLLDNPDLLLYAQPGIRISDARTTGNGGLGARYFMPDWMLGVNSFYDNDFTGNNRRLAMGMEAWRDYLKLSANGYFRLSDWRQSPLAVMQDYNERPANGWDVRAEAWLPAYPQIGGKLMYEQYQGKNVSLDGSTSQLRDNPSAVTFGLNWAPVPLIKVGVDHTTGSGISNTNLTLDFSYYFGVPLSDQLNSIFVTFGHSLAGSRYDIVDRNYDIVLQYRKQELISLSLSAFDTPYLGESVTVTARVTAKYGLDRVEWDAPALLAAGGSLVPLTADTVRVTLPAASAFSRLSRGATARYDIGAVAYDTHGNASCHEVLTLTPEKAPQDISSLTVTSDNAAANGIAQNIVEVTATDSLAGQPVGGTEVELTFTHSGGAADGKVLSVLTVTTDNNGRAAATVTSKVAGRVAVMAVLKRNNNSARTTMAFMVDTATAGLNGKPAVAGDNAVADGKTGIKVTFPMTDANGNPVINQSMTITTNNGARPGSVTVTTDENGNATITVTNTTAGTTTVTATVNGSTQSQDVNFIPGAPDVDHSSFSAVPVTLMADGKDVALLTLTLRDAQNNLLAFSSGVSLDVSGLKGVTVSSVTGTGGVYTARLTGLSAGTVTVTPVVRGTGMTSLAKTLTLNADAGTAQIIAGTLTVAADRAVADGLAKNSVQTVVTDANGNPVAGVTVNFTADNGATIAATGTTDIDGTVTQTLTSKTAGNTQVTAGINGTTRSVTIMFTADRGTAGLDPMANPGSGLTVSSGAKADNIATNTVTATVTDKNGNPVAGVAVDFTTVAPAHITVFSGVTDIKGVSSASLASPKAGPVTVLAKINSTGSEQSVDVNFTAGEPFALRSTLTAMPGTIVASEGSMSAARSVLTLTLKDKNSNPVTGRTDIAFRVSGVPNTALTAVTESSAGSGIYTATLIGNTSGLVSVGTTVGGVVFSGTPSVVNVTLVADPSTAAVSMLTSTAVAALANDKDTQVLTATVKDAKGNLVPGVSVNFAVTTGIATLSSTTGTTNGSGVAIVTVKDKRSETATIMARVGTNAADSGKTATATFGLYPVVSGITQEVNNSSADGVTQSSLIVQVSDLAGNALVNHAVQLNLSGTDLMTGPATLKVNEVTVTGGVRLQ